MLRLFRYTLLALAVAAGGSMAEAQDLAPSARHRLLAALDAPTYRAVTRTFDDAHARGIPVQPLVNRALQATLHRTPGPQVRNAVAKLADRLAIAQAALGPASTEAEIAAGANALAAGVPRETLAQIRALSPALPVTVPLGVLTELVARKVNVGRASEMVVALMRSGATPAQLVSLSDDVKHDVDAGIEPGAAFDIRTRGVLGTLEQGLADEANRLAPPSPLMGGGRSGTQPAPTRTPRKP